MRRGDAGHSTFLEGTESLATRRRGRRIVVNPLEPCFLPEDPAFGLAAGMGGSVAAKVIQHDRVGQPTDTRIADRVTGSLDLAQDAVRPPVIPEHLRHERDAVEARRSIQCVEDRVRRPQPDVVSGFQSPSRVTAESPSCREPHASRIGLMQRIAYAPGGQTRLAVWLGADGSPG